MIAHEQRREERAERVHVEVVQRAARRSATTCVGIDSSERYGDPVRPLSPSATSFVPRAGSVMNSAAIAQSRPGMPATKNAARQPYACAIVAADEVRQGDADRAVPS